MSYLQQIQGFINSDEFWQYHGYILTALWLFASALGVLVKKFNTQLHLLIFMMVDFTTLFFGGSALYRVAPSFSDFADWPTLKKGHVIGGCFLLFLMILQHLGGASAYFGKKENPGHRSFGKILVNLGRIIAAFGWLLAGNESNFIAVGAVAIVFAGLGLVLGSSKAPSQTVTDENRRSKSPRAKRE